MTIIKISSRLPFNHFSSINARYFLFIHSLKNSRIEVFRFDYSSGVKKTPREYPLRGYKYCVASSRTRTSKGVLFFFFPPFFSLPVPLHPPPSSPPPPLFFFFLRSNRDASVGSESKSDPTRGFSREKIRDAGETGVKKRERERERRREAASRLKRIRYLCLPAD